MFHDPAEDSREPAEAPITVEETGLGTDNLLKLVLRAAYARGLSLPSEIGRALHLHIGVVNELIEEARQRDFLAPVGSVGTEMRFTLMGEGRKWAADALEQTRYIGPAPVTLEEYTDQVWRQRIIGTRVPRETILKRLKGMIVPESILRRIGPAVNSGRAILLYGPPGNGKTGLAEVIGSCFDDVIYIPHAIEVDGQIIKFFDPSVHEAVDTTEQDAGLRANDQDRRWVACHRPTAIAGGELTLDMLNLQYNSQDHTYEAPLHMKACGGTFIVDDLGRQQVRPEDLLNRWIIPMEKHVDFMALRTGRTFMVPFDALIVFSTNLKPHDLMDAAFLRRIPYKIGIPLPDRNTFSAVFNQVCTKAGLNPSQALADYVMDCLQDIHRQPLSYYQPKFIVDQIVASCKYMEIPVAFTPEFVEDALSNLSAREVQGPVSGLT